MAQNQWDEIEPASGKTYKQLYSEGWQAGNAMAKYLGRPVQGSDFPKEFGHRAGVYWNGYAEGVLTGGMRN